MFREYLNEIKTKAKAVHSDKPRWNNRTYFVDHYIDMGHKNLTNIPFVFPKKIDTSFYCENNQLTSLEGVPEEIEGNFWCQNNQLTSLEYFPKVVKGVLYCFNNPANFTEHQVRNVCKVLGTVETKE